MEGSTEAYFPGERLAVPKSQCGGLQKSILHHSVVGG